MIPKKDTYLRLPSNPMAYFGFGGCGFGEKNGNNLRTCEHVGFFFRDLNFHLLPNWNVSQFHEKEKFLADSKS